MTAFVERTKNRPLASGRISVSAAVVYLILQYIIGIVMFLTLNPLAYVLSCHRFNQILKCFLNKVLDRSSTTPPCVSCVPYCRVHHHLIESASFAIYPLLKRVTYWPQAWLGFAMNFGLVVAWTAMTHSIDWKVNVTMMAGCWWCVLRYNNYTNLTSNCITCLFLHSWTMLYGMNSLV